MVKRQRNKLEKYYKLRKPQRPKQNYFTLQAFLFVAFIINVVRHRRRMMIQTCDRVVRDLQALADAERDQVEPLRVLHLGQVASNELEVELLAEQHHHGDADADA